MIIIYISNVALHSISRGPHFHQRCFIQRATKSSLTRRNGDAAVKERDFPKWIRTMPYYIYTIVYMCMLCIYVYMYVYIYNCQLI